MSTSELQQYLLLAAVIAFFAWRSFRFRQARAKVPQLLSQGAVVVDVRTRGEFAEGAKDGSINIPLNELSTGLQRLDPKRPVILCCASGSRSAAAARVLRRNGFKNVVNAGPWTNTVV